MATSASQLSVCMAQLECSIAWEKSLLKVVSPGKSLLWALWVLVLTTTPISVNCTHLRPLCLEMLSGVVGSAGGVAPTPFAMTDIWLIH